MEEAAKIILEPIGWVRNDRKAIADDNWGSVVSCIELNGEIFTADALKNIGLFSHLHIIFHFDQVPAEKIVKGARHPRNNQDYPAMGIFAQRTKNRPNRLGLTTCKLQRTEQSKIYVTGLDAIDGTPVLDIKPVMRQFDFIEQEEIVQPDWVNDLMGNYFS